jgi:hypothetical protein
MHVTQSGYLKLTVALTFSNSVLSPNSVPRLYNTRNVYINVTMGRGKAISITYWSVRACMHVGTRARERVHVHKGM